MPSFDIVSKVDIQVLDNVVNVVIKEILSRFDFKGSETTIDLDKKNMVIQIVSEDEMKINSIQDVLFNRAVKQKMDVKSFNISKDAYASGSKMKKEIPIKQGLDKDAARKVIAEIKQLKLKVEPQVMDNQVRVTGKKIDELQAVIRHLNAKDLDIPLQFTNLK